MYVGITKDPLRRRYEHSRTKEFTKMKIIGNVVTEASARKWEAERLAKYRKNHGGENPRYNHTLLGDTDV